MPDRNPCHNCTERRPGARTAPPCQTDCPRRAAAMAEREAEKARIAAARKSYLAPALFLRDSTDKGRRRR